MIKSISKSFKQFLSLTLMVLAGFCANANNIKVSGIIVTGNNISFQISWDNSWNSTSNIDPLYPNNWDGAWVFIKYQSGIDNLWKQAIVSSSSANHSVTGAGGVLQINAVPDGMGVFVRRSNPGAGNISNATVTLQMNALTGGSPYNFKVFATEVVHIPEGEFELGDGNTQYPNFYMAQKIDAAKQTSGLGVGALHPVAGGGGFPASPAISPAFPMGYNAVYCMKYEITNEQWVDFLNTLTYDQQAARMGLNAPNSPAGSYVYNAVYQTAKIVKLQTPGNANTLPAVFGCDFDEDLTYNGTNDGQNIPVIGINKEDLMAYLDWSGLRPMTEMEYEKICRGPRPRILGEFAWGSTNYDIRKRTEFSDVGMPTEHLPGIVKNGRMVLNYSSFGATGPARSGIFATSTTGRETSGATFYGVMEMTGNVTELCVSTYAPGNAFTGLHGDGSLTALGIHDVTGWPSGAATTGFMIRGNTWSGIGSLVGMTQIIYACVSARHVGDPSVARNVGYGGRGVRTAP